MKALGTALAAALLATCAQAADCGFAPLHLAADASAPGTFTAAGERIEVRFTNENPNITEPDAFPEPPAILLDKTSGRRCLIEDGGIWAREPMYLSLDETRLLTYETSGSSGDLMVYDTRTCQRLLSRDISGRRMAVEGDQLVLGSQCDGDALVDCRVHTREPLAALCRP
ncbi:hypothetical protein [Pseudomonas paralcaligenes]|uniref:hypothetical protein n=1 Tax=Pseudomonas paralcaligenes TaxID=2772558 RepID=UPI001C80F779|nr:hypothetical protein [Pseudomonas paralcaligenes]